MRKYTEQAMTNLLNTHGAFFAFNNSQFDERKQDGVKYAALGAGLICPKSNIAALVDGIDNITTEAAKVDIQENGIDQIIWRELANHEAQITMCIDSTHSALRHYPGITRETISAIFPSYMQYCRENDLF